MEDLYNFLDDQIKRLEKDFNLVPSYSPVQIFVVADDTPLIEFFFITNHTDAQSVIISKN